MFTISDLRSKPDFADMVAERIWRAFWKEEGHPLELLTGLVQQNFGQGPIPTALVAHDGERFLGTVSLIANDEESRPHYTPWVAALWVEPEQREQGIGAALVEKATELGFSSGANRLYLLAREHRRRYYETMGWTVLEANAPEDGIFILIKDREETAR